ncbi:MAG TPA: LysR family transcriptional regulator [Bdellovibrionales bacterium]|nr:LysR family transcriptional regulator [Bdellovibrionales bacterium]
MSPWINYHHLYYFKTIAEEGTVSGAAQKLRVGQPTLSAQLKQFEDTLGIALFERRHKKLILTEQGRVALDYARNIFRMGSEMYEVLHDRLKPAKPSLCIGALDTIPKQVVLQLTKSALRISRCQITLLEGRPDELLRELSAHRIDVLITNFLPSALGAKGLFHRQIAKDGVAVYGTPKFKPLRKGFPKSISGQPMILPTYDSKMRYDIEHWARTVPLELDILAESQDIAVKKLMAVSNLGLLPAAAHTVNRQVLAGELVEIGPVNGVFEELYLVTAQRKIENPIAKELMKSFEI